MSQKLVSPNILKDYSPLDGLKRENLLALGRKTVAQSLESGRTLFREGDTDKRVYYLLSGVVEICLGKDTVATIQSGGKEGRNPIAPSHPRRFTVRALTDIEYFTVDGDMLDLLLTWDQTGTYEVGEISTGQEHSKEDDWMTSLLQTKAFHRIPPANIQGLFLGMERVNVSAGDVVIKQGEVGDYFYVIVKGQCVVTRETPLNREGIRLAELGVGESFGEEALVSDAPRNATVTMVSDGALMRLSKAEFNSLLTEPLLKRVSLAEAQALVKSGGAWLDVRLPSEFDNFHLEGAVSVPLYFLRMKLSSFNMGTPIVVVCDTGSRSSAAAYLLSERGFDACCLEGGLIGNR
ncbi:MAG: cyclic nucleotide-binding domain-containing protein, partial [Steroidobacteraceae bacterium]